MQLGDSISIADPSNFPAMKPAVIVGKQHGYSALWQSENAEFAGMLKDLSNKPIPLLNERGQLLYQSWAEDYRNDLTFAERTQLERYEELQAKMLRLNRWMFAWNKQL